MLMSCPVLWKCQDASEVGRGCVSFFLFLFLRFFSEHQGHGTACALPAMENRATPALECGGFTGLAMICQ